MAKVSFYLDTRRAKAGDLYPLKFSVSVRSVRIFYPTGIDLAAKHWNGHEVIRRSDALLLNQLLGYKKLEVERALLDIGGTRSYTVESLKRAVERALDGRGKGAKLLCRDGFAAKMKLLQTAGNRAIYQRTLDAIGAYSDLDTLTMKDMDYAWLCDFDAHLRKTYKTNGVAIVMRTLRAVFNHLIKAEEIEADCYPFRRFSVKQEETRKRALTLDQLRTIRDHGSRAADFFMLTFYLIGINIVDLCNLKAITPDGRVEYRRAKTGRLFSIKVEPEALEIINRYRGDEWLVNIFDRRRNKNADHHTFMYKMNKQLKQIIPGISTYWARHTWATFAAELDVPIEVISQGLGHSFGSKTTAIYIKPNPRKVDEANRKVIDYVWGK